MAILVAGGAGYIGSHTCVELLDAGLAAQVHLRAVVSDLDRLAHGPKGFFGNHALGERIICRDSFGFAFFCGIGHAGQEQGSCKDEEGDLDFHGNEMLNGLDGEVLQDKADCL